MFVRSLQRYFILFILFLFANLAKAQLGKEAWHWQFGNGMALDFSAGTPVVGASSISTSEGCSSISDRNTGQLLFYTDGIKAWDRNNNQMPNGFGMIGGYGTSTQAALIIPKPGSSTIYYLISADYQGSSGGSANQGVHYSVVDMSLNGGLGDVVSGSKNIPLTPAPTSEKLVGAKHCNGQDYWIIDHPFNSNTFNAYRVTSLGIDTIPVVSNIGAIEQSVGGNTDEAIGYLKVSPNGKRLALTIYSSNILEIYDFDASNGFVSNLITIPLIHAGYGVSFSPDNTKLYVNAINTGTGISNLYQYDLSSNIASTIIASQTLLASDYYFGALQLGPDEKIYMAENYSSLSIINNPNALGVACNYQASGVNLPYPLNDDDQYGLPNFIDANNLLATSHIVWTV